MSSRERMLGQLSADRVYDLIVIGGGITGCGVAFEAAAKGASVLVLEQADFAFGTSSRSTKLIHGGIRYLKQLDLRLVREGVQERQRLIAAAPHLVHPVQFVYPVHRGDPDPLFMLRIGLILYDWFAGRANLLPHRVYPGQAILGPEPLLRREGLRGGALYADCMTDDARLTVEVARQAARRGAVLINYMRVQRFIKNVSGRIQGVEATDQLRPGSAPVRTQGRAVLNASGPWADIVRRLDDPACLPVLRPTKGVHITVRHEKLPIAHPVVMHAADRRLMFAVPRGEYTYLGTTDTDYEGDPADVRVEAADVAYILAAANRMFDPAALTEADVESAWAGIRSLAAASPTAGPSQVSRDYKLHISPSGLATVAGGKLTAFQAMARSIVRRLMPGLSRDEVELSLGGGEKAPTADEARALGREHGLSGDEVMELWSRHGGGAREVLAELSPGASPAVGDPGGAAPRTRLLAAEAVHAARHEFAVTLTDVLDRRTAQMLFGPNSGLESARAVAEAMAPVLGWDEAEVSRQVAAYRAEVSRMMAWKVG